MGRRKIEIQPITHERNRSVTFLKRKNGLFKKAYELGVLCSVDVAVIIFEEKQGHELKFHSYSSCDLRDMVQRQIRFQGDRDTRGPADFSGAAGGKYDDDGDDNDDDDDDDSNRRSSKRKASKLTMPSDMDAPDGPDYLPPVPRNGLPHLSNLGLGGGPPQARYDDPSAAIGSLMPVSNDRVSSLRSSTRGPKRQRTNDSGISRSNSPSLDHDRSYVLPGGRRGVRQLHDQSGPSPMIMQQHLYPPNASPGGYGSPQQYSQLFPLGGPGGPMSMGPPPGPLPPLPPRFEPQYDPALYQHQYPPNIIRQASAGSRNEAGNVSEQREAQPLNGSQRERGGGEMFAAFLEADERSRQMAAAAAQRQHQDQLNWPSSTPSPSTPSTPSAVHSNQPGANGNAPAGSTANASHWFDIFSGGTGPTTNPTSTEGANMPWSSIGADIARILDANAGNAVPPSQQSAFTPAAADSNTGKGDSSNPKTTTAAPVAPSRQETAEEAEAEKDAEGEDEDVDGAGDKKGDNTTSAMVVDAKDEEAKEEDEAEREDKDDGTVKVKTKPGRGRPKKVTAGLRGKGKAKGG